MECQEAGVTAPSNSLKYFVSYFIVFAVAAVLIVNFSESRATNPTGQLMFDSDFTCDVDMVEKYLEEDETVFDFLVTDEDGPKAEEDLLDVNDPKVRYFPIILEASKRYQVDPFLVKAMIEVESGFNPNAVSHVGAQGLMQLMPSTARALGVEDSFNPEHNIVGGVKYMKKLLDRFNGDTRLALAAYNAGIRKVRKYRGVPPFPETKDYIKKVFRLHTDYKKSASESDKNVLLTQS